MQVWWQLIASGNTILVKQDRTITSPPAIPPKDTTSTVDPFAFVREIKGKGPAPVHLWDPPFCGDIDMLISKDGIWYHEGKPIRRPAMVKLFSSILKVENGSDFFLVTPVEKVGIKVEDCPFLITEMDVTGSGTDQLIEFTTNSEEHFQANSDHPIAMNSASPGAEPHPTAHVRSGLIGLICRPVFYRLVELAIELEVKVDGNTETQLGVWSAGEFFPLG